MQMVGNQLKSFNRSCNDKSCTSKHSCIKLVI